MTGPEVGRRVTAAAAIRADFERALGESLRGRHEADWLPWCMRLAQALQSVIEILTGPSPVVTVVLPSGDAFLTAADVLTVLGALSDARWYRARAAAGDPDPSARYAALARSLGDDRD